MKLSSITPRVSDWPITDYRMQKKIFRNRTCSICESLLSQVKTCSSVKAESLLGNFRKKTCTLMHKFKLLAQVPRHPRDTVKSQRLKVAG